MGRREARGDPGVMNPADRTELGCLQDGASTGHDAGRDTGTRSPDRGHAAPGEVKKHQHKHNLKHRYELMETLGKGTYGKVKRAVERASQNTVAIKSIRKERITDDLDRVHIQREIEITSSLRHPNIIRFHEVFESRDKIVIVMEYASRGELYDYVHERRRLPETEARDIFRQITSAVHYCHKNGVIHRDLKLENILLDQDLQVKVDCWALGVLLYTLVYGSMPFDGTSHATLTEQISQGRYRRPQTSSDACALIDWLLTVRVDERATVEDVANHWWVNWGYEEGVCDCPSSPNPDCPSPLLARYIDWQNRVTATSGMAVDPTGLSSDSSHPSQASPHPFYFSFPLKGDRGGGGGRVRGGASSLRKSRKENTIPQTSLGTCAAVCTTVPTVAVACASSTVERKKPKGILKHQRSFDSAFLNPSKENSPAQPCNAAAQPYQPHALSHAQSEVLPTSLPPHSTFSQPSSKMPKKGILKNLYGGESGYASSPERRGSEVGAGLGGRVDDSLGDLRSCQPHACSSSTDDSPTMRTEAVRRRKGILKRNGKFSRSLELPDDHHSTSSSAPVIFPEALQHLLQTTGGSSGTEGSLSRPPSVVSEDSLFSCDSFDLLDLSSQSRRRIFSRGMRRSTCSSEEELEELGVEVGRVRSSRGQRRGEDGEARMETLR
ncbi:NUAK family SNF1-like kinase 1 isoform X2 [Lampris incognitus]|uniref:NUAK family SNF1-like kinase 1 isoform X2 n=1 Tax=Lampris incognitus TaxID=2546036 RepID=UPI0024B5CA33|nr:NUAK family SNF1-like kinase 1 isoform X2 [Lampris incognitus]